MRDLASAFEHERQALVKDLETMRQQLIRKDEQSKKQAAVASSQLIALKKEVADLQSQRALVDKESEMYAQKCKDLTTLLETSYDQHEEDQTKIVKLSENLKRLKKKYDDGLELAKREATISIMNTHEERKSLKANAERLRCKLNAERKEWLDAKQALVEQMEECRAKAETLERELKEARLNDRSHRMSHDQLTAEIRSLKHDLSSARQDHAVAKVAIEKYKSEICRVVEETRVQRDSDQTLVERLQMSQEDATMNWRRRATLFHENCSLKQDLYAAQQKYDALVAKRKQERAASAMLSEELSDVRRNTKRMSIAMEEQSAADAQRLKRSHHEAIQQLKEKHAAELLQLQVDGERKLAKVESAHRVLLEELHETHSQDVQNARQVVEKQMQTAVHQVQALCESTQHQLVSVTKEKEMMEIQVGDLHREIDAWRDKEKRLIQIMEHAQKMNATLEERHVGLECKYLDAQKQIDELMTSIKSLQSTIANQRDLVDEMERSRQTKTEEFAREIACHETEKLECMREIAQLHEQHSQDVLALEILKRNHDHTVKQLTQGQMSANRLIEEQAATIEDLLVSRIAETPNNSTNKGPCRRPECQAIAHELLDFKSSNAQVVDLHTLLVQTNRQVQALEAEKATLQRMLDDQAVTIHELTMQDDDGDHPEDDKWNDPLEDLHRISSSPCPSSPSSRRRQEVPQPL
ncbi:unnamed protein product [Aphanomyces euteiches]|uniref:Uncharacterized protein n=1 Tax=Aphanomyces euteiches TaxID=100861 RepID=A0A6G0WFY8_9STRA|nr:hypothetical protein Ae201684_016093 [Aphanomyces euteiches]KAH9134522.1 hypothetical protein AeRB84_019719 [Aphanomyces euteiches]